MCHICNGEIRQMTTPHQLYFPDFRGERKQAETLLRKVEGNDSITFWGIGASTLGIE